MQPVDKHRASAHVVLGHSGSGYLSTARRDHNSFPSLGVLALSQGFRSDSAGRRLLCKLLLCVFPSCSTFRCPKYPRVNPDSVAGVGQCQGHPCHTAPIGSVQHHLKSCIAQVFFLKTTGEEGVRAQALLFQMFLRCYYVTLFWEMPFHKVVLHQDPVDALHRLWWTWMLSAVELVP